MSDGLKIQGEVSLTTGNAEEALNRVGNKAGQMAVNMAEAGAKAGKAIDQIGEIAKNQGEKFTRSESAIVASIKRVTVEAAKAKNVADQLGNIEFNIAAKGLDPAKFQPMLDVTKRIAAEAQAAANAMNSAATPAIQKMGMSAAQTTAALRMVPAQLTDIVTSLASGQQPLTVLIQQGGQLKDMFGGIGPAARALGGYVASLVNPLTLAAGAAGVLAVAYQHGSKEADAYRKALLLTGNAAGTSAQQLSDMAKAMSAISGTQGKAAEALTALAATGKVGAANLQEFARTSIDVEKTLGRSVSEMANDFADLGKSPLAAADKLNEAYRFMSAATRQQIKALEDQGRTEEAAALAQRTYSQAFADRAKEVEANLGLMERGWEKVKGKAKEGWDAILDVGRPATIKDKLDQISQELETYNPFNVFGGSKDKLREEQAALQELARLQRRSSEAEGANAARNDARIQFDKEGEQFLSRRIQLERDLAKARQLGLQAGAAESEILARQSEIRKKYSDIYNDGIESQIEAIKRLGQVQEIAAKRQIDQVSSDRAANLLTERAAIEQIAELELKAFDREKSRLQEQLELTKQKQNSLKEQAALRGQIEQNDANGVSRQMKLTNDLFVLQTKAEGAVFDRTLASTAIRKEANAALEIEYSLYGRSADARELALIAMREEMKLEKEIIAIRNDGAGNADQRIAQSRAETAERIKALQSTTAQTKALAYARQLQEENKRFAADSIADEMERSAAILAIDAEEWRKRIEAAEAGTAAQKLLQEQFDDWYANRQMAPVLDRWKNIIGNLDNDFREGFRDMLTNGQNAWKSFSKALGNTLKTSLADALYQSFIKKYVVQIVAGLAGAISGPAVAGALTGTAATGATALSAASGLASIGSSVSGFSSGLMGGLGIGSDAAMFASAQAAGNLSAAASFGGSIGSALSAVPGWGWALAGAALIAKALDDSGTIHTGGAARSDQFGTATIDARSLGFMNIDRSKETESMVGGLATSIAGALNSTATAFGKTAGYSAATAFADDTSKDGAWGALLIEKMGQAVVDWDSNRQSRWAPREFADGEAGRNQYLAALSASVRDALDQIGLPSWAKDMLSALGEAPAIDKLAATVDQINKVQAALVNMGDAIAGFTSLSDAAVSALIKASGGIDSLVGASGSFYDNFYSEEEKLAVTSKKVSEALAAVGIAMPKTREEFRGLVEANLALGEAGVPAVAALLKTSQAFASLTETAKTTVEETKQAVEQARNAVEENAMKAVNSAFGVLQRSVESDRNTITKAYDATMASLNAGLDGVNSRISKLTGLSGALKSTIDRMTIAGTEASAREAAKAQIQTAIALARTGGVFPDASTLSKSLDVVSQINEDSFASFADFKREQLLTKSSLQELAGLTDSQLSIEEQTLKGIEDQIKATEDGFKEQMSYLDGILDSAQMQIDALNGIDVSIKSVADAISGLQAAISGAATRGVTGIGANSTVFGGAGYGSDAGYGGASNGQGATASLSAVERLYDKYSDMSYLTPEGGAYWASQFNAGIPLSEIEKAFQDSVRAVRGFDVGTNWVPSDMFTKIHEGERIVPKADNQALIAALQNRGADNAAVVNALARVEKLLSDISAETRATAQHSSGTKKILQRVVPDGDAIATRAEA